MRYRILVEYDGTPFVGWQMQDNGPSVQGVIVAALKALTGVEAKVQGAGRTDAGVHAMGQVAHFDLDGEWDARRLREGLNALLRPHPVAILEAQKVSQEFHARHSAIRRQYLYRILNRRAPPVLEADRVWHVNRPLDADGMHAAAQHLVGRHDFTAFRSSECQAASAEKTLDRLDVRRAGEAIEIVAEARSFLHNQVRSMVGTLKLVSERKWSASMVGEILHARDRTRCGPVAPPQGLYLIKVEYD
ncbi:MAG: tRNA pseudouridine(38-40) synthase TruA [Pseudomonadota bacterium]|nr:tRNA pseudouridine(38-40) synthase TruA [Pseudomonadota bacterium]